MATSGHSRVQVPPGVQCFYGSEASRRRAIEARVVSVFEGWDYEEIIPPLFDYADVFSGRALASRTWSFVGRDGSLLALRPDFTSLVAKIAAGRLAERPAPLRLYYSGEVLRYEPPRAGRQGELHQMGLEHLGGERLAADAEIVAVADECLSSLGIDEHVFSLGHVGVFSALLSRSGLETGPGESLAERIGSRDAQGAGAILDAEGVTEPLRGALLSLALIGGGPEALDEAAERFAFCEPARGAVDELKLLVDALVEAGLGGRLRVDLGQVQELDYYTGLVLRAYVPGFGFEVASGGRYDGLLARFGRPLPAVGFMLGLDRLASLLGSRSPETRAAEAEGIDAGRVGTRLARARERRAAGARVRFGDAP